MASDPRYGLTVTASDVEDVEQGDGLARGRRPDVGPLGVGDDRHVGRDRGPQSLERRHAGGTEGLEERQVRLDRSRVGQGRLEDERREPLDPGQVRD